MNQIHINVSFEKILQTNIYLNEEINKNKINHLKGRIEMRLS
jgi:protocatechuate 3,4-dioxygenase beta subunit